MLVRKSCSCFKFYFRRIYIAVLLLLVVYIFFVTNILFDDVNNIEQSPVKKNDGKDWEDVAADKNFVKLKFKERLDNKDKYRLERYERAQQRSKDITGPGEDGRPVTLTPGEQKEADRLFSKETYNVVASGKIAMDRRIPDLRHPECRDRQYPADLPSASVVIIFCNEASSGLLRTVHSVVNRSPPGYLREVVLIDDFSDRPELGAPLEEYLADEWPDGIVKLARSNKRLGLIRAKIWGAELSVGEVVVFLDAHCEAADKWLEPILSRIKEKPRVVVCPVVDAIDDKTLEYSRNSGINVGGFTWSLHFTWRGVPEKEKLIRKSEADPVMSPTMAGGLLAAGREFFFEIGAYDPGMVTWGGENLELSFRVWMCGGELEFIPCSRVGHVFRGGHPYVFDNKDSHGYNSKRLAEVWMDDYKRLFYNHRHDLKNSDAGDLKSRKELRKKLGCKSFKWYLEHVFPEQFIMDENSQAYGRVRNPESDLCLDSLSRRPKDNVGVYHCTKSLNQMFGLSQLNELRMEEVCLDAVGSNGADVNLYECHGSKGNQEWHYNPKTKTMIHSSGHCLDVEGKKSGDDVVLRHCNGGTSQKWEFEREIKFL